jgi:transposase
MIGAPQHQKLMREYQRSGKIGRSAAKAGVDRKTAAKYIHGAPGPGEPRAARAWRTREDVFSEVWPSVERRLEREPKLLAKTLWEELGREHPGRFRAGQRRTFERRVREWKEANGGEASVVFRQEHAPGERLQIDWVDCRRLEVRVGGSEFPHKLVHAVLPCSNWEWARVCASESFLSLKTGLQSALRELGGVPGICQTDNSSTATHQLDKGSRKREYNARFLSLLAHYGMRPALIAIGEPRQNGDVESAHHHLLRALDQRLMLSNSGDDADSASPLWLW